MKTAIAFLPRILEKTAKLSESFHKVVSSVDSFVPRWVHMQLFSQHGVLWKCWINSSADIAIAMGKHPETWPSLMEVCFFPIFSDKTNQHQENWKRVSCEYWGLLQKSIAVTLSHLTASCPPSIQDANGTHWQDRRLKCTHPSKQKKYLSFMWDVQGI